MVSETCYCIICNGVTPSRDSTSELYGGMLCGADECQAAYDALPRARCSPATAPYLDAPVLHMLFMKVPGSRDELDLSLSPPIAPTYRRDKGHMLEPLFQEGLFFGLLKDFLGPMFDREAFIDGERAIVSVEPLVDLLPFWIASLQATDQVSRTRDHFAAGLNLVSKLLLGTLGSSFSEFQRQTIATAAEFLAYGLQSAFPQHPVLGQLLGQWAYHGASSRVERLLERQWCP